MVPIRELLTRCHYDPAFAAADFEVAWREEGVSSLRRAPMGQVEFEPGDHALFYRLESRAVPLHRVREFYRNGALIWRRTTPLTGEEAAR